MKKLMAITMLMLTGCGDYPDWTEDAPYPIGTCFNFTADKQAVTSVGRSHPRQGGEYWFVITMPADDIKPVECQP